VPLDWAMTQMNLGEALAALGKQTDSEVHLKGALIAMKNASDVYLEEAGQIQREGYLRQQIKSIETALGNMASN